MKQDGEDHLKAELEHALDQAIDTQHTPGYRLTVGAALNALLPLVSRLIEAGQVDPMEARLSAMGNRLAAAKVMELSAADILREVAKLPSPIRNLPRTGNVTDGDKCLWCGAEWFDWKQKHPECEAAVKRLLVRQVPRRHLRPVAAGPISVCRGRISRGCAAWSRGVLSGGI